jgi:tetratricopeptide (TPR) repeat protein
MTCDDLRERIAELVEDGAGHAPDPDVEAHLASCGDCRSLLGDLRRIRQVSATLERRTLPAGTWAGIAARLEADPDFQRASAAGARSGRRSLSWVWMAAAASLLVSVGVSLWVVGAAWRLNQTTTPAAHGTAATEADSGETGNASPTALVESIEAELQAAASHYEKAIAGLEQVASASDSPLDPALTATLRQNLEVIDKAIADSREALKAQPDSRLAQESLFDAFRRKVALLQDTIALMNEMRKGNDAGAARIVEGLKKS